MIKSLSIVIPSYNESKNIPELYKKLESILNKLNLEDYEIIFIDNGSIDNSLKILKEINLINEKVKIISFSRNFGQENAIMAGIKYMKKENLFIINGDLQDPPELLELFSKKMSEGYDVVYGVKKKREASFLMKFFYKLFYFIYSKTSEVKMPRQSGNLCLMNKKVLDTLKTFRENIIFLRGLRTWVGFKQTGIEYQELKRIYGATKFSFYNSFLLALDGFFSFTLVPLRLALVIAIITSFCSFLYLLFLLTAKMLFIFGITSGDLVMPKGLTAVSFLLVFFSCLTIFILGIISEYIAKIYLEVKNRPRYIINEIIE
ncbi:glycosyltransferase family 2 protein [Candidatus Pelagibacter bacterium nBUS_44]|uniref:glycosyltransferase family 2 protein n=1 Tax=Candidatus Pelagibacter bacterium nBUS_44 TaxID=3374195 RepID=UPI003EBB98A7